MKQPKKLTRDQKHCLSAHGLDWHEWMLAWETATHYSIVHKKSGAIRNVDKFLRDRTKATGSYSHAEGCETKAFGGCSHAEGWNGGETKNEL